MTDRHPVICVMGPTATGKTDLALRIAEDFPVGIVSVDSALVYREMNIGTAKPAAEILARVPHALVDIREPEETYSAGDFVRDASTEIRRIVESRRVPLLVGGTMLYFRALIDGIAQLPESDQSVRNDINAQADRTGWPAMHKELQSIDPVAAGRINVNDSQRIQRAMEVYRISGKSLTELQSAANDNAADFDTLKIALMSDARSILHDRIALRLNSMIEKGFLEEVRDLMARPGLSPEHASMRAVGYRQVWSHLASGSDFGETKNKVLAATRQLCKRQFTWLRSEKDLQRVDPLESDAYDAISVLLRKHIDAYGH